MTVVIVHGGAWDIPLAMQDDLRSGCETAAQIAAQILSNGGHALDAVEAAVRCLEEDPRYNAGRGSALTRDGTVEVDAAVMTGDGRAGAVGAVPNLLHPVTLARRLLEKGEHVFLVGAGALAFGADFGIVAEAPGALVTGRARERLAEVTKSGGTVGAVALDSEGHLAAATSTGGITGKRVGRVGDTPILGAGTWVDDGVAASATGHGESIMKALLTRRAADLVRSGAEPQSAAMQALGEMESRTGGKGGIILVDAKGGIGIAHSTTAMSFAVVRR